MRSQSPPFVGHSSQSLTQAADGAGGSGGVYLNVLIECREVDDMKGSSRFSLLGALVSAALMVCLSGCVIHNSPPAHDSNYAQGYQEGYYDREHNRYWHEKAWHDCVEHDEHCADVR